jgi:hypothetical protein
MSDGPPSEDRTVPAYLDYLALACVFGIVETLVVGKWRISLGMLAASLIFHNVGIKWLRVKSRTATLLDWGLWGKRVAVAVRVLLVLSVLAILTTGYYVKRTIFSSSKRLTSSQEQVPSTRVQSEPHFSASSPPRQKVQQKPLVSWRDKQNWRASLHTGMTRTEVRRLFGDPEHLRVYSTMETWDYGNGEITFVMDESSDGSLYSWDEP